MKDKKFERYLQLIDINDKHNTNSPIAFLDTVLRYCIRLDRVFVSSLSHNAIINREMQGEICRVCLRGIEMLINSKRFICNDYLVLRHPQCINPICSDCIKSKPDVFYKAYRRGLDLYEIANPYYLAMSQNREKAT